MIYLFEIPEILDKCEIHKLLHSEKLSAKEYSFLVECHENRSKFVKTANFNFALEVFKSGDSLLNFQKIFDEYLKTNVDMVSNFNFFKKNIFLDVFAGETKFLCP